MVERTVVERTVVEKTVVERTVVETTSGGKHLSQNFETIKMHLVSDFYDLPLQSWFFGQLEPIRAN